jgi:hypothetical protein
VDGLQRVKANVYVECVCVKANVYLSTRKHECGSLPRPCRLLITQIKCGWNVIEGEIENVNVSFTANMNKGGNESTLFP